MAQSVDQLEQAGYLERRPNPRDGRSRLIVLTERGKAVLPLAAGEGDVIDTLIRTLPIMCRAVRTGRRLVEVSSSTTFWFECPTHGSAIVPFRNRDDRRLVDARSIDSLRRLTPLRA
jgi:DNA-binding MarR family transcriptional regulator